MRVLCPQCRVKLSLHRPSVSATRVKCRSCGHKFYVGKAEEILETPVAASVQAAGADSLPPDVPETAASAATTPAADAFDQDVKLQHREVARQRLHERQRKKQLKWLVPVGMACLAGMIVMGIVFAQKAPSGPSQPSASLLEMPGKKDRMASLIKPPSVDSGAFVINVDRATRPAELIGIWTDAESGSVFTLREDGTAQIKGPLIDATPVDVSSSWFAKKVDDTEYRLDFGPEPFRAGNYIASMRTQADGTLRLIRFGNAAAGNFKPRIFKKTG